MTKPLSKSRLQRGLQCTKSLYLTLHHPELAGAPDSGTEARLEEGRQVGRRAQLEFPGGLEVTAPYSDPQGALAETAEKMKTALTLFEATFATDQILAKVDVLHRDSVTSGWQLIEVKSTTHLKDEHLTDVAIQTLLLKKLGLKIESAQLMYLNREATAPDLKNLFIREEILSKLVEAETRLPAQIESLQRTVAQSEPPAIEIGPHCTKPYPCPFQDYCWKKVKSPSIFDFPGLYGKVWDFYRAGITELQDPKFGPFVGKQAQQLDAIRTQRRWIDRESIRRALAEWQWPLLHLDFETMDYAVPQFDGTHPYQQVPFQYSLMRQEKPLSAHSHFEYLHQTDDDPRRALVEKMVPELSQGGSIVAYYKTFEGLRLEELARAFPEHASALLDARDRLVDPLPLFREFVYDPQFKDSFSIKSVAPAILGPSASYAQMEVPDGKAAQRAYLELIHPSTTPTRKKQLDQAMRAYCQKDTEMMVLLVDWLFQESRP